MIRILIVEDNLIQAKALKDMLNQFFLDAKVTICSNYSNAEESIKESIVTRDVYSMFLLDIQLSDAPGDRGGYVLSNYIRSLKEYYTTPILFLTSIQDDSKYALNAFHCYSYISKPYSRDDLFSILTQMQVTGLLDTTLSFADIYRIAHNIVYSDIMYIKSKAHTTYIVTKKGTYPTRNYNITSLAQKLPSNFIRCHNSYIINKDYVENCDNLSNYVRVASESIPIGRHYKNIAL